MLKVVEKKPEDESEREVSALDRLAREGARRMLEQALEAEVEEYIERHRDARDEDGRALVVRNGRARSRSVVVGAGVLDVQAPRVNDKRVVEGDRQKFTSEILPPYLRKSRSIAELLPALYLRGLSTGDFRGALAALLGDDAPGFSPSVVTRLVSSWQAEYDAWKKGSTRISVGDESRWMRRPSRSLHREIAWWRLARNDRAGRRVVTPRGSGRVTGRGASCTLFLSRERGARCTSRLS